VALRKENSLNDLSKISIDVLRIWATALGKRMCRVDRELV